MNLAKDRVKWTIVKPGPKRKYPPRQCFHCGDPYFPDHGDRPSRYCSNKCQGADRVIPRVVLKCPHCSKEFERRPSEIRATNYCSYACRAYALSVGRTIGVRVHKDSESRERGAYWKRQASRCRARDGYRCQDCGRQFAKGTASLDAHHKVPRRLGGSDHLGNLISLCRKCHRKADAAIQSEELKNWPAGVPRPKYTRQKSLPNHCKHGHELTPENIKPRTDNNGRRCLTCYQIRNKRKYQEAKNDPKEMARLRNVGRKFAIANPERIRDINAAYRTRQKRMLAVSGSVTTG